MANKVKGELVHIVHPIPPVYDEHSRVLILGSFPSVKSREMAFFYGHPQNRYWRVLSMVFEDRFPETVPERRSFLLRHQVAAWDVIHSCDIYGSADQTIKNAEPNDLRPILENSQVEEIFVNGKKALQMYQRYIQKDLGREATYLPSTSPANAAWSLERLVESWRVVRRW